jgi:formin 2
MARNRAMAGPGSKKMGGAGIKAGRPPTAMAGSGLGAGPGSPAAHMGAPPMAPKVANVRPPGIGAGAPPPMPGGGAGAGPPPPPPGGMGGSGGFAKGGPTDAGLKRGPPPDVTDAGLKRQSPPDAPPDTALKSSPPPSPPPDTGLRSGYAKGGAVGGDVKARHKGTVHKGR